MVFVVMWHILFSMRIAVSEQRHDMPPLRSHHHLSAISLGAWGANFLRHSATLSAKNQGYLVGNLAPTQ